MPARVGVVVHPAANSLMRTRLYVGRLAGIAIVTFSIEVGLMLVAVGGVALLCGGILSVGSFAARNATATASPSQIYVTVPGLSTARRRLDQSALARETRTQRPANVPAFVRSGGGCCVGSVRRSRRPRRHTRPWTNCTTTGCTARTQPSGAPGPNSSRTDDVERLRRGPSVCLGGFRHSLQLPLLMSSTIV